MCPVTQEPPSTPVDLTNYRTLLVRSSRRWDLFPDGNVFIEGATDTVYLIPNWNTPYLPNGDENMLGKAGITIEAIKAFVFDSTGEIIRIKEVRTDKRTLSTKEMGGVPSNGAPSLTPPVECKVDKLQQEK